MSTRIDELAERFIRSVAWPLIDLKNRSVRLEEWHFLQRSQWETTAQRSERSRCALRSILEHAYRTVPFYRGHWGRCPDVSDEAALRELPIVSKADIRRRQIELVSSCFDPGDLVEARTGGSTGVALRVLFDHRCQDRRNAAAMRSNEWAGWLPAQAAGALWGNPPIPKSFRDKVRAVLSERLIYLDTVALTEESVRVFMDELCRRGIRVLFGHAHSLYTVASLCQRLAIPLPPISSVISTSMMLLEPERRVIEACFGCPVSDRYGCEEVGLIASECEQHDGMHINDDHLVVEILGEDGRPAAAGEVGQVVVTDLINYGMPLIRYAVGDMSEWMQGDCACGRGMPRLKRVLGRTADFLKVGDDKLVAGVSLVERTLTAIEGLEQMQIVQHSLDRVTVRCVLSAWADQGDVVAQLRAAMQEALSSTVSVDVQLVSTLSQDRNGKYRFSICEC
jgi:phenylacetate-CoA ligase